MATARLKRAAFVALICTGVALGTSALLLLARTAPDLAEFGRRQLLLLAVNTGAAVVMLLLISLHLARLVRDYRRSVPGARLRARMVAMFAGLAVVPLAVVYVFAILFLNTGIDRWFDNELGQDLTTALRLSRESLETEARSRLAQAETLATAIAPLEGSALTRALEVLRADAGADELTVFDAGFNALSRSLGGAQLPAPVAEDLVDTVTRAGSFSSLEVDGSSGYDIRTVVTMPARDGTVRYLQAVFPVPERQSRLADAVQETFLNYSELRYLRGPLKSSLVFTLSLVLLLSALAAAGGAFYLTRRLVAPLEALVAGTEAVARGDFDMRLKPTTRDEVGFLLRAFNDMTARLAAARAESRASQEQLERERTNLAVILGRLSTGVVAIDADRRIRMANAAAAAILGTDLAGRVGEPLDTAVGGTPLAAQFVAACAPHLVPRTTAGTGSADWRGQVTLRSEASQRILNCASTSLPQAAAGPGGFIIVFDDVTALLQAQRDAAWGEVARRLAHEIKNPLTPIRLAAERIRRRYLPAMAGEDGQVLDRSTNTIVQQVEAMRDMVNAFSEYARAPEVVLTQVPLNQLVSEIAWLYRPQAGQPQVQVALDPQVTMVVADAGRVRQVLHNLVRNAQEALEGREAGVIGITTRLCTGPGGQPQVEVAVADNGPGIDVEALPDIFEPYMTTKKKGTGLGLAIVKKLVEEHGGSVAAANLPGGGARMAAVFPVGGPAQGQTTEWAARGEPPDAACPAQWRQPA
jgi:nitrogen fixation/metabolism regulation signal transduction histidine kinase